MALPEIMSRIWDGDEAEYFTHIDMRRVEYNANIVAREAGVEQVTFVETAHDDQFDYSEAQKLENLIKVTADAIGVSVTIEAAWGMNRSVSYVDFERWESNIWACYTALGGIGDRIPSDKKLIAVSATLFASAWQGTGPYYYDIDVPSVYPDSEAVVFVHHSADIFQRVDEAMALLRAETLADRKVRVWALNTRPRRDLLIRISMGGLRIIEIKTLTATGWTGDGPWEQNITLSSAPSDAIAGIQEDMTDDQAEAFAAAGISPSAVSGTTVTMRAILEKPTVDIPIGVLYNTGDAE
jgi:hypothetical protein